MIKSLLIAAALMSAGTAFASKARTGALQNAAHLTDFQNGFEKPQQFTDMNELVTFEWGTNGAAASPHAEGGFLRKHDAGVYGFYLGRRSEDFSNAVTAANAATGITGNATLLAEQNAWNLLYGRKMGDMKIGFNFKYSKADMKKTALAATAGPQKVDTMGFSLGAEQGAWDAALVMGLSGNSTATTNAGDYKLKTKSNMKVHGGYKMDSMYFYGLYKTVTGTVDSPTAAIYDTETTDTNVGVIDTVKKDGAEFFYGISYNMRTSKEKISNTKTDTTTLPLIIGVEADAASWLTLRGSITQDTNLVGGTKNDTGTDLAADNTVVAAGAGMKFNKFVIDGTLTATTGKFMNNHGTDGFMANTSLTYNF